MSALTVTTRNAAPVVEFDVRPKASLVKVTPQQASKWLESNTANRPIRYRVVDSYARDMTAGTWQVTGDALKFALDGCLLDGQHRLAAVVQSGCTVPMFVVRGLARDAQEVMDSGVKRQASDALGLRGYRSTTLLAAIARLALTVDNGGFGAIVGKQRAFTTSEITAFVEDHPELQDYARRAPQYARNLDASATAVGYAMWRLYALDAEQADVFFEDCREGAGLTGGNPVLALRRRFAEARRHRETIHLAGHLSLIFKAWNARQEGREAHRLQVFARNGEITVPEPKA